MEKSDSLLKLVLFLFQAKGWQAGQADHQEEHVLLGALLGGSQRRLLGKLSHGQPQIRVCNTEEDIGLFLLYRVLK